MSGERALDAAAERHALLVGEFAELDAVAARAGAAALFEAYVQFPAGLRVLAGVMAERWCRAGGFARLDLPGLAACVFLTQHKSGKVFAADAGREYVARVLALPAPALSELIRASYKGIAEGAERQRFEEAVRAAA